MSILVCEHYGTLVPLAMYTFYFIVTWLYFLLLFPLINYKMERSALMFNNLCYFSPVNRHLEYITSTAIFLVVGIKNREGLSTVKM